MKVRICPVCNCEMPLGTHYAQKTCGNTCGKVYKERRRQERQEVYQPPAGEAVLPAGRTITDPRNAKRPGRSPFSIGVFDIETSGPLDKRRLRSHNIPCPHGAPRRSPRRTAWSGPELHHGTPSTPGQNAVTKSAPREIGGR